MSSDPLRTETPRTLDAASDAIATPGSSSASAGLDTTATHYELAINVWTRALFSIAAMPARVHRSGHARAGRTSAAGRGVAAERHRGVPSRRFRRSPAPPAGRHRKRSAARGRVPGPGAPQPHGFRAGGAAAGTFAERATGARRAASSDRCRQPGQGAGLVPCHAHRARVHRGLRSDSFERRLANAGWPSERSIGDAGTRGTRRPAGVASAGKWR